MNKENLPERKNIRLKNRDYSEPGAYFITICTKNKEKLLWNGELDIQKFDWQLVGAHRVRPRIPAFTQTNITTNQNLKHTQILKEVLCST